MDKVMETLRANAKEGAARIYRRHGATGEVLGVSSPVMLKLQKQHRGEHALAQELWRSGVHEARLVATQIADPAQATRKELEGWLGDLGGHPLTDAFAEYVARTPLADACMTAWMKSKNEWTASAGWRILTALALRDDDTPPARFEPYLAIIEQQLHGAQNRVRHVMNNSLIAIGARGGALETKALRVARAIGVVEVDHGETACQTPDAAAYIAKMKARREKKKA